MRNERRGRPTKYGRPASAVTLTLPNDVLARLSSLHADIGSAIVHLVERRLPSRPGTAPPVRVNRYGTRGIIVVTPSRALRRLKGVQLIPVGDGRALIALAPSSSISSLELQVRDAIERLPAADRDREGLQLLADILRRTRGARGPASEARTIIVLAARPHKRAD